MSLFDTDYLDKNVMYFHIPIDAADKNFVPVDVDFVAVEGKPMLSAV